MNDRWREKFSEGHEEELRDFRNEILNLVEQLKNASARGHLEYLKGGGFNPNELDRDDMRIWQSVKDDSITMERFNAYRSRRPKNLTPSQEVFMSVVANQAAVVIGRRQLRERKKK